MTDLKKELTPELETKLKRLNAAARAMLADLRHQAGGAGDSREP